MIGRQQLRDEAGSLLKHLKWLGLDQMKPRARDGM